MTELETLEGIHKAFKGILKTFVDIGIALMPSKSEDYKNGFKDGADLITNIILGTLERAIEEKEDN